MKKLQARENYTLVKKDKSQIYGKLMYSPDTFEDYIEVPDSELEEIQKQIDLKMQEEMKKFEMEV